MKLQRHLEHMIGMSEGNQGGKYISKNVDFGMCTVYFAREEVGVLVVTTVRKISKGNERWVLCKIPARPILAPSDGPDRVER